MKMSEKPLSAEPEIIVSSAGKPFESENVAKAMLAKKKLEGTHEVIPMDGGFALKQIVSEGQKNDTPQPYKEKYFWVMFAAKTDKYQTDDVVITCNGDALVFQRMVKSIAPQRYLEIAENANYPVIEQKPNHPRKTVAIVTKYPRTILGEATEQEFLEWRRQGTTKLQDEFNRKG